MNCANGRDGAHVSSSPASGSRNSSEKLHHAEERVARQRRTAKRCASAGSLRSEWKSERSLSRETHGLARARARPGRNSTVPKRRLPRARSSRRCIVTLRCMRDRAAGIASSTYRSPTQVPEMAATTRRARASPRRRELLDASSGGAELFGAEGLIANAGFRCVEIACKETLAQSSPVARGCPITCGDVSRRTCEPRSWVHLISNNVGVSHGKRTEQRRRECRARDHLQTPQCLLEGARGYDHRGATSLLRQEGESRVYREMWAAKYVARRRIQCVAVVA